MQKKNILRLENMQSFRIMLSSKNNTSRRKDNCFYPSALRLQDINAHSFVLNNGKKNILWYLLNIYFISTHLYLSEQIGCLSFERKN